MKKFIKVSAVSPDFDDITYVEYIINVMNILKIGTGGNAIGNWIEIIYFGNERVFLQFDNYERFNRVLDDLISVTTDLE